jgi:hypothetical protein
MYNASAHKNTHTKKFELSENEKIFIFRMIEREREVDRSVHENE